jgi:hypothetical protein
MYAEQRWAKFRGRARWIAQGSAVAVKAGRSLPRLAPLLAHGTLSLYMVRICHNLLYTHTHASNQLLYMSIG